MAAFLLLTLRFSPNWVAFYSGLREVMVNMSGDAQQAAVEKAVLSGHSARGLYVIRQAQDLASEIEDPNHKIVRWRLLWPALGHYLRMPGWLLLSMAHLGCMALTVAFVALGFPRSTAVTRPMVNALCLGLVGGASAPFFTSMGWLGYFDSWLALALLGVAFARRRPVVLMACLLAPWVDERFVIGLPLALCVRRLSGDPTPGSNWAWFKDQAVIPLVLVFGYSVVRLQLGGSGGSQTMGEYLNQFVLGANLAPTQRVLGAWEGLRVGWFLVGVALFGGLAAGAARTRAWTLLLAVGAAVTGLVGLFTALDLSRSMVLLIPLGPLGWILGTRLAGWSRYHVAPILATIALVLPARHVVGQLSVPVDDFWSPSLPLMGAQNNLGTMYYKGEGSSANSAAAVYWFRQAAEHGHPEAQRNLGIMYATGNGVPQDIREAVGWYRKAAEQGYANAQQNLGLAYDRGEGVARDAGEASKWYRKAAEQGLASAQYNLGVLYWKGDGLSQNSVEALSWCLKSAEQGFVEAQYGVGLMYAVGNGIPKDSSKAVKWYRRAAEQGHAGAQCDLGVMYATGEGVPKDLVRARRLLTLAANQGHEDARRNLAILAGNLTSESSAESARSVP